MCYFRLALCMAMLSGSGAYAQAPTNPDWAIFGTRPAGQRGDSKTIAHLDSMTAHSAYLAVVAATVSPARRLRTRLGIGWLPDSAGYVAVEADSMFLAHLAIESGLKGVCTAGRAACYQGRQAVLTLSRFFQVGPDALRVFALWETDGYAAEAVLLLRQVNGRWAVVATRTVMVT